MPTLKKYQLVAQPERAPVFDLHLARGTNVLGVGMIGGRGGKPFLFTREQEQGTGTPRALRTFAAFTTGDDVGDTGPYIGTFEAGPLLWHIFEMAPGYRPKEAT